MILDEAIKHAEEVAVEQDKLCKRYDDASGYTRSHNEAIRTTDAKRCEECADEHRQLAEWLKDYKRLKEREPCTDAISRQAVDTLVDELARAISDERCCMSRGRSTGAIMQDILDLPPVNPQETVSEFADRCRECGARYGRLLNQKWTPVSEELPEDDRYLTTILNEYDNSLRYVMTCDFINGDWCPDDECASNNVIAWMPLPEPYKAEGSEK